MLSNFKVIVLFFFALSIQTSFAQRLFFGIGMPFQPYHHASTNRYYVLPSSFSYDVRVVKQKQSQFILNLPTINFIVGLEYGRWKFTTEPTIQPLNFPYKTYYPTGNGQIRTPSKYLDVEDFSTSMFGLHVPVVVHLAIWNSRQRDQNLFLQAGASYFQNFKGPNSENIFYQSTYTWAIVGLGYQTGGMYRANFYMRYLSLLNANNVAEMKIGTVMVGAALNFPSIKVQKRKLYIDEIN